MTKTCLFAALLGGLAACAAGAPTPVTEAPPAFGVLDPDGDGEVTRDAWDAYSRAVIIRLDDNGDAALDTREMARSFDDFDLDGSGGLSVDEIDIGLLDGNRDGTVTPAEWDGEAVLKGLDMDRDGRVTVEEMLVRRHPTFTELDRNATGVISRDEVEGEPPYTLFRL